MKHMPVFRVSIQKRSQKWLKLELIMTSFWHNMQPEKFDPYILLGLQFWELFFIKYTHQFHTVSETRGQNESEKRTNGWIVAGGPSGVFYRISWEKGCQNRLRKHSSFMSLYLVCSVYIALYKLLSTTFAFTYRMCHTFISHFERLFYYFRTSYNFR